ncbi:hypothetical protein CSB66_2682 [Enterobacter hormaechei]|nr:hypothetical protein CSB66_2682 [Enterobacter hormaechei]
MPQHAYFIIHPVLQKIIKMFVKNLVLKMSDLFALYMN